MARAAANGKPRNDGAAPEISVIVVVYESGPTLAQCLAALRAQTFAGFEVILVDNASSDRVAQAAARADPAIRLIENADNLGFAAAVNQGAKAASGRWLALLNPDAYAEPDWLARLAGTPAETVPARLVELVDEAMARHRDDPRWQTVQAEADLLWLACDTGPPDGAAPPGEPDGALPPAVARAAGWTGAGDSYAACPQAAAVVRLRVYPPAALRFLLSRRETVLRARPGDTSPAPPAVPADRDCAVVIVKDQALEGRVFLASPLVHAVLRQADGTRTPAALARETGIPEARLTALLDGLARAGLIRWTCYPQPRVASALRLVPAGR